MTAESNLLIHNSESTEQDSGRIQDRIQQAYANEVERLLVLQEEVKIIEDWRLYSGIATSILVGVKFFTGAPWDEPALLIPLATSSVVLAVTSWELVKNGIEQRTIERFVQNGKGY